MTIMFRFEFCKNQLTEKKNRSWKVRLARCTAALRKESSGVLKLFLLGAYYSGMPIVRGTPLAYFENQLPQALRFPH